MEYKITLPDHDFVIAERHKLIPSVSALCVIDANKFDKAVSYSGPTYVAIRDGKRDSSSAASHNADFEALLKIKSFRDLMISSDGLLKPVLIVGVDGGPDENPRYPKTLASACHRFQTYDLDAMIVMPHAPGYSAYNNVERRMAPLSNQMAGVVLPYDTFGSHLDASGKTVDEDKERDNFEAAGRILATLWSELTLDGHDVHAQFINPVADLKLPDSPSAKWAAQHVRQSQYLLQVVKCFDEGCCGSWRSQWKSLILRDSSPPQYQ
jgi:hypothetical protein